MNRKTKRWLKWTALGVLGLLIGGAGVTVYLIKRPPMMYRHAQKVLDQTTEASREQIRDNVLIRLADLTQLAEDAEHSAEPVPLDPYTELYRGAEPAHEARRIDGFGAFFDPTEDHAPPPPVHAEHDEKIDRFVEMALTNAELVSFVNEMFVAWTIQRGYIVPGGVNDPAVIVKDGRLALAFAIQTPYWEQVFSGDLDLTFKPNGMAIGRVTNLRAGSLPVSLSSVGDMLHAQMPAGQSHHADRLAGWLDKLERFEFRPVIELGNRRRARVYALHAGRDSVSLRLRVQDRLTYKQHNHLLNRGAIAVTDQLGPALPEGGAFAEVQTTTE